MITLERFRRELGPDCPSTEAEVVALFEQLGVVADVVVASLRSGWPRAATHDASVHRASARRAHACDARPLERAHASAVSDAAERFEERAAILEYDAKLPRGAAEVTARKQSRRKRGR